MSRLEPAELGPCVSVESIDCVQSEVVASFNEHGALRDQIKVISQNSKTYLAPVKAGDILAIDRFLKSSLFTKKTGESRYIRRGNLYRVR